MNWNLPLPQLFTLKRRIAKAVLVPFCKLPSRIKPPSLEEEDERLRVLPTKKIEQDFPSLLLGLTLCIFLVTQMYYHFSLVAQGSVN